MSESNQGKLDIYERRGEYCIAWFFDEDKDTWGGPGLVIGEPVPESDSEAHVVERAVEAFWQADMDTRLEGGGYAFTTKTRAIKALKAAKTAIKNIECPMPDWAIKATAAGWKAPKGWKP